MPAAANCERSVARDGLGGKAEWGNAAQDGGVHGEMAATMT
jgi:hypothetical protein